MINYDSEAAIELYAGGSITCESADYRPILMTAVDDHTVGQQIGSGTLSGFYAEHALELHDGNHFLNNIRISHAEKGISLDDGSVTLRHGQIVHCRKGLNLTGSGSYSRNVLFSDVQIPYYGNFWLHGEHLTVHQCDSLVDGGTTNNTSLYLTNCVLVHMTNWGPAQITTNVVLTGTDSSVFERVGAGAHYLSPSNTWRNLGTTNINSTLLSELRRKTTYAPLVMTNKLTVDTVLSPQAQRDTDDLDPGFHYDPIDYAANTVTVTNATLLLTNGVAVAVFGDTGFWLQDNSALRSVGLPHKLNYLTRYRTTGQYSRALAYWEAAWEASQNAQEPNGKRIADYTLSQWTQLLASLGRVERLEELVEQTKDRRLATIAWQERLIRVRSAVKFMRHNPGASYRCGTLALYQLGRVLSRGTNLSALLELSSPETGFSMEQLVDLATIHELDLVPARRNGGEDLVVPSVVHWKQNHYPALVAKDHAGRYRVTDATFGRARWLSADAINSEASGAFLIPGDHMSTAWKLLGPEETSTIFGKGINTAPPNAQTPRCEGEGELCCTGPGSPAGGRRRGGGLRGGGRGGGTGGGSGAGSAGGGGIGSGGGGANSGGSGGGGGGGGAGGSPPLWDVTQSWSGSGGCCQDSGVGQPAWTVAEPYISL